MIGFFTDRLQTNPPKRTFISDINHINGEVYGVVF
ncbi:hypothetical protein SAMN05444724_3074 [Salinivibrio sp. ES.052]|nr:hypothetical protein SAMN05444724_3074 [Salinivibrio sp. ES.052]